MFNLEIETGNAAFEDSPATEVARILRNLADRLEDANFDYYTLTDINGNKVGSAAFSD